MTPERTMGFTRPVRVCVLVATLTICRSCNVTAQSTPGSFQTIRVATFNVSLNRSQKGQLRQDLASSNSQARRVAGILREIRPDVVLLNEFDFDSNKESARLFREHYLETPESSDVPGRPLVYPHAYSAPVNTGVPSGMDVDRNGRTDDPADAYGFGRFPGQYGMLVLSRYAIDEDNVRTFQKILWQTMPDAAAPVDPDTGRSWYDQATWEMLRLSSKSHWDVPIHVEEKIVHLLVSHPTPPAFDGPEDRNGRRNHDEIRFWSDYLSANRSQWVVDDKGIRGGLPGDAVFVIAGDLNADPVDGASYKHAIQQLLRHPRINASVVPDSTGGTYASIAQAKANDKQSGTPAYDTADFSDRSVGNLRVDYVLPSFELKIHAAGVHWPMPDDSERRKPVSDHHAVWMDVQIPDRSGR